MGIKLVRLGIGMIISSFVYKAGVVKGVTDCANAVFKDNSDVNTIAWNGKNAILGKYWFKIDRKPK